MISQLKGLSLQTYSQLFDEVKDALISFSQARIELYRNKAFDALNDELKQALLTHIKMANKQVAGYFWCQQTLIKCVFIEEGTCFIISPKISNESVAEITLQKISQAINSTEDIYFTAAKAISECLPWRWVSITRFTTKNRLEVLTFIDASQQLPNYEYDLFGTPCEAVFDSNRFTIFSDVIAAFPNYQALEQLGAKTYAGLIYRGSDNQALGHIMVMHDHRDVDFTIAEEVISTATLILSSHFLLHSTERKLNEAEQLAKLDGMTGINNRLAYEEALNDIHIQESTNKQQPNWTIAIVDLDNLKSINDTLGHIKGDQFIKLMAIELTQLGRESDQAFRIGGDEFALLFTENSQIFKTSIIKRLAVSVSRVRSLLQFPAGASIGMASLSETKGNIKQWIKLADQRMYEHKQVNRLKLNYPPLLTYKSKC